MIETVNHAMMEIQGALIARSLYPHRHAHIRAGETRALDLLESILREQDQVEVFALDERVIFDGELLPSSSSLARGLFGRLRGQGADRISFGRGISGDEIEALLDRLSDTECGDEPLDASAHVSFGFVKDVEDPETARVRDTDEIPLPGQMVEALQEVWEGIFEGDGLDGEALGDIVASVSKAVADSAGVMLPLASLKRHDEYTFVHTINVAILATALGEAVGFKGRVAHELNMAALLHDIGKRNIPSVLLNKIGAYTEEEFRLVKMHPVEGARLLFNTPGVPEIAPVVAFEHHVRADHSGYPRMPRGWKLSLASRIVQVADVFDALRSHRPYRPALEVPEIFEIMHRDIGHFFDADLLGVFFERVVSRGTPQAGRLATSLS